MVTVGFVIHFSLTLAVEMKQRVIIIAYWALLVLLTAFMLCSLSYSFSESCLLGCLLLPGGIVIKFMLPKILLQPQKNRIINLLLLVLTALIIEILLTFVGHGILLSLRDELRNYYYGPDPKPIMSSLLVNPVFLTILLILFAGGDYLLTEYLRKHLKQAPPSITFTSDRKPVSLLYSDILYVESNDTEVWIHSTDGQKYRNKTPISQWENLLGIEFVRIHRSFLVSRSQITKTDSDSLTLTDGQTLPISRKYREQF